MSAVRLVSLGGFDLNGILRTTFLVAIQTVPSYFPVGVPTPSRRRAANPALHSSRKSENRPWQGAALKATHQFAYRGDAPKMQDEPSELAKILSLLLQAVSSLPREDQIREYARGLRCTYLESASKAWPVAQLFQANQRRENLDHPEREPTK